ncbi:hypothetical protein J1614_002370 [Plenodomus biglobosus]|nr:hypothetical protein J1614_002370 [Plenodomus biglobosus]
MRFESIFAGAALVAAAIAQNLAINSYPSGGVVAGQTYEVTYSPADNTPTTFILRQGSSTDLDTIGTLTTSATGGKFSWTVDRDLDNEADYALEIRRGDQVNYSGQFALTGGDDAVSSAMSSAASSAASAASSAASSASAALSSVMSSVQASATISPSAGINSTVSTASLTRSATGTGRPTATSTASIPESTGAAAAMGGSPIAAIFGAIAAFAYLA